MTSFKNWRTVHWALLGLVVVILGFSFHQWWWQVGLGIEIGIVISILVRYLMMD